MRQLDTTFATAITGSNLFIVYAAEFEFGGTDGTVRFWTGVGELLLNGSTYYGVANMGGMTAAQEDKTLGVNNVTFTISGIPTEYIALVMNTQCRNKPCRMFAVVFNEQGNISVIQTVFAGRMDQMSIREEGSNSTISISAESHLIDFNRPRLQRWTYNQRRDSTDNGLMYISRASAIVIPWGSEMLFLGGGYYDSTGFGGNDGPVNGYKPGVYPADNIGHGGFPTDWNNIGGINPAITSWQKGTVS